jgi:hypothetical protein
MDKLEDHFALKACATACESPTEHDLHLQDELFTEGGGIDRSSGSSPPRPGLNKLIVERHLHPFLVKMLIERDPQDRGTLIRV